MAISSAMFSNFTQYMIGNEYQKKSPRQSLFYFSVLLSSIVYFIIIDI